MRINEPLTNNGDSRVFTLQPGRRIAFAVAGDFAGNTITLLYLNGETWVPYDFEFTSNDGVELTTVTEKHKINVSGGGEPDLNILITPCIE